MVHCCSLVASTNNGIIFSGLTVLYFSAHDTVLHIPLSNGASRTASGITGSSSCAINPNVVPSSAGVKPKLQSHIFLRCHSNSTPRILLILSVAQLIVSTLHFIRQSEAYAVMSPDELI